MHGHQALRRDYQKLIAVMKELTAGLESVTRACAGTMLHESLTDRDFFQKLDIHMLENSIVIVIKF